MLKIRLIAVAVFLCGIASAQIYTPKTPTIYGEQGFRYKPLLVQHMPMKESLTVNTSDTTAQLFFYGLELWQYTHTNGFEKVDKLSGGGGEPVEPVVIDILGPYLYAVDDHTLAGKGWTLQAVTDTGSVTTNIVTFQSPTTSAKVEIGNSHSGTEPYIGFTDETGAFTSEIIGSSTGNGSLQIPNNSGYIPVTVNGELADANGNITIATGVAGVQSVTGYVNNSDPQNPVVLAPENPGLGEVLAVNNVSASLSMKLISGVGTGNDQTWAYLTGDNELETGEFTPFLWLKEGDNGSGLDTRLTAKGFSFGLGAFAPTSIATNNFLIPTAAMTGLHTIPLTVNGQSADATTGNITVSVGGSTPTLDEVTAVGQLSTHPLSVVGTGNVPVISLTNSSDEGSIIVSRIGSPKSLVVTPDYLQITNSLSGVNYISGPINAGGFTNTLPAKSGIFAMLSDISSSVSTIRGETFTGSTSSTITLAHAYTSGTLAVFKNGVRIGGFTEATSTTITLTDARLSADTFLIDYNY